MTRAYPRGFAKQVEREEWMSQDDAAAAHGVLLPKVGLLIANGHLEPTETRSETWGTPPVPVPGVSRESVERELEWRRSATVRRRIWRMTKDGLNWF